LWSENNCRRFSENRLELDIDEDKRDDDENTAVDGAKEKDDGAAQKKKRKNQAVKTAGGAGVGVIEV
jgi:hypothetical protein